MTVDPIAAAKFVGNLVAGPAIDASKQWINYVQTYDTNVTTVQRMHRDFENVRTEIIMKAENGDSKNEEVVPEVRDWLNDANNVLSEADWKELLRDEEARRKAERCCFGCCWSPFYRHGISKRAEEKTKDISEKIDKIKKRGEAPVTLPTKPVKLASTAGNFCGGLKSREDKIDEIFAVLRNDKANRIGIYGMGGAGKTTIIQELARRAENEKLFNAIVIAEISQFPDFKRIQDQIADRIGFSLDHYHDIDERARNLGERLTRIKRGKRFDGSEQHGPAKGEKPGDEPEGPKNPGEQPKNPGEKNPDEQPKNPDEPPPTKNLDKIATKKFKKALSSKEKKPGTIDEMGQDKAEGNEGDNRDQEEKIGADGEKEVRPKGKKLGDDEKQGRVEKSGKLLVILDNIWKKLDLHLVGIPYELEKDFGCKIIVISRNKDVCKSMGATESRIFKVGDLNDDEAERLFRERVGMMIDNDDYKQISKRLLKKCSRLPLSINVLADTLKNQTLSVWERILRQMEKPTQGEAFGVLGDTYSIIEMSYNYLGSKEKKMFFLLCCLFPPGSTVHFDDLLRYGIGLGLFQYVNSIVEAIDQAHKWADDLKSLSLLSEVDVKKGEISIHDDVREAGKSFAAKGEHVFHVGAIPRWLKRESYKKYTIVSMTSDDSYKYLAGRDLPKLQLLRCLGVSCANLRDNYFSGMSNLKVLDLSRSVIEAFPLSMEHLQNLETLLLEYCSLKDVSHISKLVNLQTLSFKESNITRLPKEMGGLVELKLLDLSNCNKLHDIPAGIFANLSQLEGLYMKGSFSEWTISQRMASLAELKSLPLHVVEITIKDIDQLPDKDFPVSDLSVYKIDLAVSQLENSSPRDLQVGEAQASDLKKEGWKSLMNKAETLYLQNIEGLKNVAPYLGEYGFRELKRVKVSECSGMECFINRTPVYQSLVFPKLEVLCLEHLPDLVAINHEMSPPTLFSDLQQLTLSHLEGLKSFAISIQQANRLKVLEVKSCENLEFIFDVFPTTQGGLGEVKGNNEIQLPCLEKLILANLNALQGLSAVETNANHDNNCLRLFRKIIFPSLDKMKLKRLHKIEELWDMTKGEEFVKVFPKLRSISLKYLQLNHVWNSELCKGRFSFAKLKKLKIRDCDSLKTVCPISVAGGLEQLELLRIRSCNDLEQVISTEVRGQDSTSSKKSTGISFRNLLTVDFVNLYDLLHFYKGSMKVEFPILKSLKLDTLRNLETFLKFEKSKKKAHRGEEELPKDCILFSAEIKFPCLEQLYVESLDTIEGLWAVRAQEFSTVFPKLQSVSLNYMDELKYVWSKELSGPNPSFINLKDIEIDSCDSLESLFLPSAVNSTRIKVSFSELHTLKVESSDQFKYFLQGNVNLEFPVLKKLGLMDLEELRTFAKVQNVNTPKGGEKDNEDDDDSSLPLFTKKILFPSLEELQLQELPNVQIWDMTNSDEFNSTFPNLQTLAIENMPRLKYVWNDELKEKSQIFGNLENIGISGCGELKSLFSFTANDNTPRPQSRKVISFPKLQRLLLSDLDSFECVLHRNSQMEFQALKELTLRFLPLVKILVKLEKWDGPMRLNTDVEEPSKQEESANEDEVEPEEEGSGEAKPNGAPGEEGSSVEAKPNGEPDEQGSGLEKKPNGEPDEEGSGVEAKQNGKLDEKGSSLDAKPNGKVDEEGSGLEAKPNGKVDEEGGSGLVAKPNGKVDEGGGSGLEANQNGEPDEQGSGLEAKPNVEPDEEGSDFEAESNGESDKEGSGLETESNTEEDGLGVDAVLFRGNVEFSSLEELRVKYMDELEKIYETEIEDVASSSIFPKLQTLHLTGGGETKLKHLPAGLLHKLSSLFIRKFSTFKSFVSAADVSEEAGLLRSLSELEKLENLTIKNCDSIENLFEAEGNQDGTLLPNLKMLELSGLAKLKQIQWHVIPNLQSLTVTECFHDEEYLIQDTSVVEGLPLQLLEKMVITDCESIEAIVGRSMEIQDDRDIIFPQLKEVVLNRMHSLGTFSSARCATTRLPSLVSVDIVRCGLMRSFSSRSIITPKLSHLEIDSESVAIDGDLNDTLQSQFDSNNMVAKSWPHKLKHKLHEEHELKLSKHRSYGCDGCKKRGTRYSYTCYSCRFDLHPACALEESQLIEEPDEIKVGKDWPKTLKHDSHERHELKLVMGRDYGCDECREMGELYSYYCQECDFDLHPKCALPDISASA